MYRIQWCIEPPLSFPASLLEPACPPFSIHSADGPSALADSSSRDGSWCSSSWAVRPACCSRASTTHVTIPGTESQNALDRLATTFPQVSGASAQVIVVAPEGGSIKDEPMRSAITDGVEALGDVSQVEVVTSPFDEQMPASISDDERATLLTIQLDGDQGSITDATKDALHAEADALAQALPDGAEAQLGGQLFSSELPKMTLTEGIGLLVALVVLVLTLGSLVGAGLPLLNALLGVVISMGLLFAATALGPINSTTPLLAVMLGLAVGIDYALFIVSRHREQLGTGLARRRVDSPGDGDRGFRGRVRRPHRDDRAGRPRCSGYPVPHHHGRGGGGDGGHHRAGVAHAAAGAARVRGRAAAGRSRRGRPGGLPPRQPLPPSRPATSPR